MKLAFLFPQGNKIVVRRCRPCPPWASGERLGGYIGGFFGFGGKKTILYFKGPIWQGELVAIWLANPRVRIYPRGPCYRLVDPPLSL